MLDSLLGRAELKARIEELEAESERLRRRLDAEGERRAEAVTARQDAEERANRLEDRIAELEGRIERLGDEEADLDYRGVDRLRGGRLGAALARLRSFEAGPEGALTAAVGGDLPDAVRDAFGDRAPLIARAAPCIACADDAGLVSVALAPPLAPEPFCEWGERFRLEESWFRPSGRFGFALVRSDLFALGVYDGETRRSFEGFESDVMNAHSKGGFSQARFERRRESQIDEHLDRCRDALAAAPEPLIVVGERTVLGRVREFADRTAASDARGDPEEALSAAFDGFWSTSLYRV